MTCHCQTGVTFIATSSTCVTSTLAATARARFGAGVRDFVYLTNRNLGQTTDFGVEGYAVSQSHGLYSPVVYKMPKDGKRRDFIALAQKESASKPAPGQYQNADRGGFQTDAKRIGFAYSKAIKRSYLEQAARAKAFVPSAKPVLSRATVLGGILLGTINVGSLFFLLSAYQSMPFPRSAIVPSNNLGIVLATALAGIAFFKERPDGRNILGWALATTALVLLLLPN